MTATAMIARYCITHCDLTTKGSLTVSAMYISHVYTHVYCNILLKGLPKPEKVPAVLY